mgnify:CR=1 FL=1
METFLLQLFIFLTAAAIAVPVAKKLGLGSALGKDVLEELMQLDKDLEKEEVDKAWTAANPED